MAGRLLNEERVCCIEVPHALPKPKTSFKYEDIITHFKRTLK